jgi:hypothetical protein
MANNDVESKQTQPPTDTVARKAVPKALPKWESDARERIKLAIRRYSTPLAGLVARDANEGDTRLLVTDFLCDALGFDKYSDLTTEYLVKGEFADYGIRIDKQLVAFIEVKRATTKLDAKHLRQVEMYAVNEGVEWVVLTNGSVWRVYHITGGLPMILDLAIDVNLLGEEHIQKKADKLFYLTKESLKKKQIDELWRTQRATSPRALAEIVLTPLVVTTIQKELKKRTGYNVDVDKVKALLQATVLRPECFDKEGK